MDLEQVQESVTKEIKAIGAESKSNYEALQRDLSTLRTEFDSRGSKTAADVKEEFKKIGEAVSLRQDASDKAVQERMDAFEVQYQRSGGALKEANSDEFKATKLWQMTNMAYNGKLGRRGLKNSDVDCKTYEGYKEIFPIYLRGGDNQTNNLSSEEQKFLLVGSNPDGGYQVPVAMSGRVTQRIFETSPIRSLASVETISVGAMEFGTDLNETSGGGWVGEQNPPSESGTPQIGRRRIEVHEQYEEPKISQTMLEDSIFDVEGWLARKVGDRMGRRENTAFVNGDGVLKPRGFLTYTAGTDVSNTIEQVAMGDANVLTTDGFTNIKYSMVEELIERGSWLMNRTTVRDTMLLKDGDGQYIWRTGLQPGQPSTILNLTLRMATDMPAVAANALAVALAVWPEAYLILDRLGITVQRDPYTAKPYVLFYTRKRVGGDVVNFQAIKIGKISA